MAFLIYPNGNVGEITPSSGVIPLHVLQEAVGGNIDARYIGHRTALLFNEDADILGLPMNLIATVLAQTLTQPPVMFVFMAGTVVIADLTELGEAVIPSLVIIEEGK